MEAPKGGGPNPEKVGPRRVGPEGWRPRRVEAPKGGGPEGWRPRRVEAPKRPQRVGPGRVGPEGPKILRVRSRQGFTRQPESPNVHISGSQRFKKHHQNSTKGPPREGEKNENCGGRKEKKKRNFGRSGGGLSGGGLSSAWLSSGGFGVQGSGFRVKNKMKSE